jgi:hypothetical protein
VSLSIKSLHYGFLLSALCLLPTTFCLSSIGFYFGAEGGIRTRTVSRPRDPKSRAYSNFATPALSHLGGVPARPSLFLPAGVVKNRSLFVATPPPVTDKPIKSMSLLHLKRMAIVILNKKTNHFKKLRRGLRKPSLIFTTR